MSEPRGTPETSMEEILAAIRRIISEDGSPPAPQATLQPVVPPPAPIPATPILTTPILPAPPPAIPRAPVVALSTTPPAPPSVTAETPSEPASVWGIFGDRPPVDGEALVLTRMLAEDGSVVALDRPTVDAAPGPTMGGSAKPSNSQPLDVLLLTDALPPSLPETGIAPRQKPVPPRAPAAPRPPIAPAPPAAEKKSTGPIPAETSIQSNPVLTELAQSRARDGGPTLEELVRQSLEPKVQEWLNANLQDIVERLVQREIERIRQRTE